MTRTDLPSISATESTCAAIVTDKDAAGGDAAIGHAHGPHQVFGSAGVDHEIVDHQVIDLAESRQPLPFGATIGRFIDPAIGRAHVNVPGIGRIVGKSARIAARRTYRDPRNSRGLRLVEITEGRAS